MLMRRKEEPLNNLVLDLYKIDTGSKNHLKCIGAPLFVRRREQNLHSAAYDLPLSTAKTIEQET